MKVRNYSDIMNKKAENSLSYILRQKQLFINLLKNSFEQDEKNFKRLYYSFTSVTNYTLIY